MPRKNRHLRTRFPTKTRSFVMEKMGPREGGGGVRGPADFFFRCVGRGFPGGAVSRSISPYSALSSCTNCTGWLIIHTLLRLAHPLSLRCESPKPIPTVEPMTAIASGGAQDPSPGNTTNGKRGKEEGGTCWILWSDVLISRLRRRLYRTVGRYPDPSAASTETTPPPFRSRHHNESRSPGSFHGPPCPPESACAGSE